MENIKWTETSHLLGCINGTILHAEQNGIKWIWKSLLDSSETETLKNVYFAWKFEYEELKKQGIEGFVGTITVAYISKRVRHTPPNVPGFPKIFTVRLNRSGQWIEKSLGNEDVVGQLFTNNEFYFRCAFHLTPIRNSVETRIPEELFAPSDKTDAILVVEGRKLHVNKQFLSFHSEFFNTLFNSEFREKSMDEIPIEDVSYEDFARLLSVIYPNSSPPTVESALSLLELADRFMMPMVTRLVEPFLIRNENVRLSAKLAMADKYSLEELMKHCLNSIKKTADVKKITETSHFDELSDATKLQILYKILAVW